MKIVSDNGTRANIKVTEAEVQQMIYTYERWIKTLSEEKKQLKSVLDEVKEYVTNELKNFERLINTSPTPSFYQLPYGVCVSILNKIEKGGSNE